MEKSIDTPRGVTGAEQPQNSGLMSKIDRPSGWRKTTHHLLDAEHLAGMGEGSGVPKSRAFVAVKRVGAHIGLKAGDLLLLDTLGAFTQPQDWESGCRPIVWPSNALLMDHTGFSLSALKRHARRLADHGVISFRDSANGKRWGHRNAHGYISEAYGFDLSPLAARAVEFENLYAGLQAERALCQRLKRQITVARRMIRARLMDALADSLRGPWDQLVSMFDMLLAKLPRRPKGSGQLQQLLVAFDALQTDVETAYCEISKSADQDEDTVLEPTGIAPEMAPKEAENEPHILTTNKLNPVTCSHTVEANGITEYANTTAQNRLPVIPKESISAKQRSDQKLTLKTVMKTCPEFGTWAQTLGSKVTDWGDLHRVAGQLAPMIGVSKQTWHLAEDHLGKDMAACSFALIFEKHSKGELTSPTGYLRGMLRKAAAGELHIDRSFYGRLSGLERVS